MQLKFLMSKEEKLVVHSLYSFRAVNTSMLSIRVPSNIQETHG